MKRCFALTLLLCLFGQHVPALAVPSAMRKSADGIDFPPAAPNVKFHSAVPLGGMYLGKKPEELGRVFNCQHSAALLAKRTTADLGCDWFIINFGGADVAGISLTDGRVTKLVYFYQTASPLKVNNIRKLVESRPDAAVKVTFLPIGDEQKPSLLVTFEIDPLEFYIASHEMAPKIADALRQHTWLPEMTDEQAMMIGDGPGKYVATFAGDRPPNADGVTGGIFADAPPPDVRIEITARNKEDARQQALKRHKNLKDITKVANPPAVPADKP